MFLTELMVKYTAWLRTPKPQELGALWIGKRKWLIKSRGGWTTKTDSGHDIGFGIQSGLHCARLEIKTPVDHLPRILDGYFMGRFDGFADSHSGLVR